MKTKQGYWFIALATVVCVVLACGNLYVSGWATAPDSPVSFWDYRAATKSAFREAEIPASDRQTVYETFRDIPFFCTQDLLEEELDAIQRWGETGVSPVSWEEANEQIAALYVSRGGEGGLYPPEGDRAFVCTPVMLENMVRFLDAMERAEASAGTGTEAVPSP